jgi:UDP-2-acetamido-3-amino-2,3-dideoxy-glucuronate N-acetyltransferase
MRKRLTDAAVHPTATVHASARLGAGTRVWDYAQVREGAVIGEECILGKNAYVDEHVRVGNRVKIQNNASVYSGSTLEDGVFIGPHVCLTNDRRPRSITADGSLKGRSDWETGTILVRTGASLGAGAIIATGVTIGRWALVGAGAVVIRDVPDHGLVVGNPARLIGWVCVCAQRLKDDGQERMRCPVCDAPYERDPSGTLRGVERKQAARR